MASKVFKKLGKSKLAKGILAAAVAYFLGSYLSDSAADVASEGWGTGAWPADGGLDAEALASATGGSELVAEPPGTPTAPPLEAAPVASPPAAAVPAPAPTPATQPATPPPNAPPPASTAQVPGSNLASKDGGIIAGAQKWWSGLSPGGQAILAAGTAGGAAAVAQALAQKHEQEFQEERAARAEENKQRRTAVAAIAPGAFTPRRGIINSRNG